MKRVGQLMEEIGFRKSGSDSVKKAFLEHLFQHARASQGDAAKIPALEISPATVEVGPQAPQQLSFDFAQDPKTKIS